MQLVTFVSIVSAPSLQSDFSSYVVCFHRYKQIVCNNHVNFNLLRLVNDRRETMLNIHLRSTGERFKLTTVSFESKVRDLKTILEIICGVPAHLQILTYLDEGSLQDSQKLKYYDPVPNCTFELDVWFIYEPIVQAVVANNETKVVVFGSEFSSFSRSNVASSIF